MGLRSKPPERGPLKPSIVPKPLACDVHKLPLDKLDAYVLSQVDGKSRADELAAVVGVSDDEIAKSLLALHALGAVELPGHAPRASGARASPAGSSRPPPSRRGRKSKHPSRAPPKSERTKSVVQDVVEFRKRPRANPRADRAHAAAEPSPPSSRQTRPPRSRRHATRVTPNPPEPRREEAVQVPPPPPLPAPSRAPNRPRVSIPSEAAVIAGRESMRARVALNASGEPAVSIRGGATAVVTTREDALHSEGRRRQVTTKGMGESADAVLRRFFHEKRAFDGRERARTFTDAAESELAKGNVIAAAAHLQAALECCDARELRIAYDAVEELALQRRYDLNSAKAKNAERDGRWAEAAAAYERAHAARPDPALAERCANALRLSSGDLRLAVKLAEEAVHAEPDRAPFRVTLSEVYAAAGLELRAAAEANKALELAPDDARARELVAKVNPARGR